VFVERSANTPMFLDVIRISMVKGEVHQKGSGAFLIFGLAGTGMFRRR